MFKMVKVPLELQNLPCISTSRGNYRYKGRGYSFKVDKPVTVFLLVDYREKSFNAPGWEKTGMYASWKADRVYKDFIYKQNFPAGTITIPQSNPGIIPHLAVITLNTQE